MKKIMIELTEDLHTDFKTACAKNQQSFKDALTDLIKYYVVTTKQPLKLKEDAKK